ncbi:hypothetical protein J6590_034568 [Homalodisca vitripennis]|nr:hypothetical protein J6590_034568 [Homalodisca vitripennis]
MSARVYPHDTCEATVFPPDVGWHGRHKRDTRYTCAGREQRQIDHAACLPLPSPPQVIISHPPPTTTDLISEFVHRPAARDTLWDENYILVITLLEHAELQYRDCDVIVLSRCFIRF